MEQRSSLSEETMDHGHNVKLKTILTKVDEQDWIF